MHAQMIWVGSLCDREQEVSVMNVHHVSWAHDWQQLTDFFGWLFQHLWESTAVTEPSHGCVLHTSPSVGSCCPVSVPSFWAYGCSHSSCWDTKRNSIQCGLKLELSFCYWSSGFFLTSRACCGLIWVWAFCFWSKQRIPQCLLVVLLSVVSLIFQCTPFLYLLH